MSGNTATHKDEEQEEVTLVFVNHGSGELQGWWWNDETKSEKMFFTIPSATTFNYDQVGVAHLGEPNTPITAPFSVVCQDTVPGHEWRIKDTLGRYLKRVKASDIKHQLVDIPSLSLPVVEKIAELFTNRGTLPEIEPTAFIPAIPLLIPKDYTQRLRAPKSKILILAYVQVAPRALELAADLIDSMMQSFCDAEACRELSGSVREKHVYEMRKETLHNLRRANARIAIIARDQVTTDIPEHRHLKFTFLSNTRTYDNGTRGLGGTKSIPVTSVGEENILQERDTRYPDESVLIHEWAHAIQNIGFPKSWERRCKALYQSARSYSEFSGGGVDGLDGGSQAGPSSAPMTPYNLASYVMSDAMEYFAELTQAWFHATLRTDVSSTDGINTRDLVRERDPAMADFLMEVFGDTAWKYKFK